MNHKKQCQLPSASHLNRKPHNWLLYDQIDKHLFSSSSLVKGALFDLGCGDRPYEQWFRSHCQEYICVDWPNSDHRKTPDIFADLNKPLPLLSGVAETVVAMDVLEHLNEPKSFISEISRVLAPGGVLILRVPWQWWIHEAPFDYFRFSPHILNLWLKSCGFVEISVKAQGGFFTTLALKTNYFLKRRVLGAKASNRMLGLLINGYWYVSQKFAPILDRLDDNWNLETCGYFVTAVKP